MQENTASTEVFKARNRLHVRQAENGGVEVGKPGYLDYTTPAATFALEEFFQAKRDRDLERWRCPTDPNLVVYENQVGVAFVFDEDAGDYQTVTREGAYAIEGLSYRRAARAYFEAHPESKPWHDANHGEVWELDFIGVSSWVAVEAGDGEEPRPVFRDPHTVVQIEVDDPKITAGRRIYPEDAS